MQASTWASLGISGGALLVSALALFTSTSANKAAGPRVLVTNFKLVFQDRKWWLEIKIANSGHLDIDIDGAWAGVFGAALTDLPVRLANGSSKVIIFRTEGSPRDKFKLGSSLTIQISLGNGETLLKRIRLDEVEIAAQYPGRSYGIESVVLPVEEI